MATAGIIYNNCGVYLKAIGSEPISAEHRDMSITIMNSYRDLLDKIIPIFEPHIVDGDTFLTRVKGVSGYDDNIEDLYETIDYTIEELEENHIWYYVGGDENVGAKNYLGWETIRQTRFEDVYADMYAIWLARNDGTTFDIDAEIKNNLANSSVRLLFDDLLHEVDHSITRYGHAAEFQASNNNFISMNGMGRTEQLDHMQSGDEFTYFVERGYTETILDTWLNNRFRVENLCQESCVRNVDLNMSSLNLEDAFIWFGISDEGRETIISDICQTRTISRESDEAEVCSRHPTFIKKIAAGSCDCAEKRIKDLEVFTNITLNDDIEMISEDDLKYLVNINKLTVTYKGLEQLIGETFKNNLLLEEINLRKNNIFYISPSAFNQLSNLKLLKLDYNGLENIVSDWFLNLSVLEELDLRNNQINSLREDIFIHLSGLKKINLTGNTIVEIKNGAFNGINALESMILKDNQISDIQLGIFDNLASLKVLNLSSNKISNLPNGIFNYLINLNEINLRQNQLTDIPQGFFENLISLQKVYLQGNNFDQNTKNRIKQELKQINPNMVVLF